MPTIAAMAYKYSVGQPFVYPRNDLDYAANFLHMCFSVPAEKYEVNPILSRAMDRIFTLHADHEQNASTSTVRLASSSGANPFACIAAGIACLWGPAHGGANQACLEMLKEIGSVDRIPEFIARAKDKSDPFRLMGFGHRVYKNFDPRATVMKQSADEVLDLLGIEDNPLLQVAKELERIALQDDYFADKKLFPNVDFYSGIILEAMGFPTSMFTPIFALSRTVGWVSQWKEMISDPQMKIGRPRQLYLGANQRDYVVFGAISVFLYCCAYTPIKTITPLSVFVGAIPGAIPFMLGWVSVTGSFGIEPGILFVIQFFWQFPHFWAIGWLMHEDYQRAGINMLPTGKRDLATALQVILYTLWTLVISVFPVLGMCGTLTLTIPAATVVGIMGLIFLWYGILLYKNQSESSAKKLMIVSIIYIMSIQWIYVIDKFL